MSKAVPYALRLPVSVMRLAKETAEREGVSLNQFIASAVAEKLSAMRAADFFRERARGADRAAFEALLDRTGKFPPREGDELDSRAAESG
jgi:hypothetical protein